MTAPAVALPAIPRIHLPRPSARGLRAVPAFVIGRLRGRALIVVLAALLLGLVFLQVTLLGLNTGISQNVVRAQVLERDNGSKRALISRLEAGQRIEDVAARLGMVMPGAGAVCYLKAGGSGKCSGGDPAAAGSATDPAAPATLQAATPGSAAADQTTTAPAAQDTGSTDTATAPAAPQQDAAPQTTAAPQRQQPAPAPQPADIGGMAAGNGG
ncbi:unannotated protein [freshwater metagenome]|uniref:Unannotated protein n=1 Tax=freshwater metagenome TaxID=449393 RepID=A0A6J7I6X3_9ZZZZ|nr:hypothetical protein [Actinomycetota bacterium]